MLNNLPDEPKVVRLMSYLSYLLLRPWFCSKIFLVKQKAHTQGYRIEAKIGKNLVTFMHHKSLILVNQLK